MARLEFKNISHSYEMTPEKSYDEVEWAIKDMNIVWKDGTANALLGPSGCGKTTILNILSGLLEPTEGRVLIDGKDVTELSPQERHIAQVFQFPVCYDSMDVYNNLAFPLVNKGVDDNSIDRKVKEVAEILGLTDYLRTTSTELNAAEKQKVSLGRGIIRDDTVAILLDEPLTVIDPKMRGELRRSLKKVQEKLKITMIYVTHDQHEALTFADHVTIVKDGFYIQGGTPHELYSEPESPFVGYFIGSPGMNIINCELIGKGLDCDHFVIPLSDDTKKELGNIEGDLELGIRPESIDISTQEEEKRVEFNIAIIEDMGNYKIVTLERDEFRMKGRINLNKKIKQGDSVYVKFPEDNIKLFEDKNRIF